MIVKSEISDAKWIGHQKTNYTYNIKLMKYETVKKMWEALVKKYEVLINIKDTTFSVEEKLKMLDEYITEHNTLPIYELELDNGFKIGSFLRCIYIGNNEKLTKPYIDKNPLLKDDYIKFHEKNNLITHLIYCCFQPIFCVYKCDNKGSYKWLRSLQRPRR